MEDTMKWMEETLHTFEQELGSNIYVLSNDGQYHVCWQFKKVEKIIMFILISVLVIAVICIIWQYLSIYLCGISMKFVKLYTDRETLMN